jgi:hypothetical protein
MPIPAQRTLSLPSHPNEKPRANTAFGWLARIPRPALHAAVAVLGLLLFSRVVPFGGSAAMTGLALYALTGSRQAIQALTLLIVVLMGSPAWIGAGTIKDLRWLVLLAAFVTALVQFGRMKHGMAAPVKAVLASGLAFVLLQVALAPAVSRVPEISFFKSLSFGIGLVAVLGNFAAAGRSRLYWEHWFTGWFAAELLAGVLCMAWGGGHTRNVTGYEGAFAHPQTNGVVMAVAASYFFGRYLLVRNCPPYYLALGVAALAAVYLSQARTGGLAFLLGGGAAVLLTAMTARGLEGTRFANSLPIMLFIVLVGLPFAPAALRGALEEYVVKDTEGAENMVSALRSSRQELMDVSMDNYRKHPTLGIGFGVPSDDLPDQRNIKRIAGIPVSATSEKGFMPTAILEETGIVGAAAVVALLLAILAIQFTNGHPALGWAVMTAILTNLGEAMFFSMGGLGLFVWLVIGWSVATRPAAAPPARRKGVRQKRRSASSSPQADFPQDRPEPSGTP